MRSLHLLLQVDKGTPTSPSHPQWLWSCFAKGEEAQGQGSLGLSEARHATRCETCSLLLSRPVL